MGSLSRFLYSLNILGKLRHCLFSSPFSSSSSSSTSGVVSESVTYLRSMLRPPSTVVSWKLKRNLCSFIGTLDSRVQCSGESSHGLQAFAFLLVKSDYRVPNSSSFCVCLRMQGRLAQISLKHLKPNDFIYVSGTLDSYKKHTASGEPQIFYKVYVDDLNFVRRLDLYDTAVRPVKPVAGELFASPSGPREEEEFTGESGPGHEKQHLDRMHLWQLFFGSPSEWWDNRRAKRNPSIPDFRHKDTKECLWISPDDPPWVRRQLQLYDTKIDRGGFKRSADDLLDTYEYKFKGLSNSLYNA